jgi:hypothetical protein
MSTNKKSLDERFDQLFKDREKLDKEYWAASEKLTTEWEELMKELEAE